MTWWSSLDDLSAVFGDKSISSLSLDATFIKLLGSENARFIQIFSIFRDDTTHSIFEFRFRQIHLVQNSCNSSSTIGSIGIIAKMDLASIRSIRDWNFSKNKRKWRIWVRETKILSIYLQSNQEEYLLEDWDLGTVRHVRHVQLFVLHVHASLAGKISSKRFKVKFCRLDWKKFLERNFRLDFLPEFVTFKIRNFRIAGKSRDLGRILVKIFGKNLEKISILKKKKNFKNWPALQATLWGMCSWREKAGLYWGGKIRLNSATER